MYFSAGWHRKSSSAVKLYYLLKRSRENEITVRLKPKKNHRLKTIDKPFCIHKLRRHSRHKKVFNVEQFTDK